MRVNATGEAGRNCGMRWLCGGGGEGAWDGGKWMERVLSRFRVCECLQFWIAVEAPVEVQLRGAWQMLVANVCPALARLALLALAWLFCGG